MNANTRYEITAKAFDLMTGLMAPGKDAPAALYPITPLERAEAWHSWKKDNQECIDAMITAFESVTEN